MNPIWQQLLALLQEGHEVVRVEPDPYTDYPAKIVIFHYANQQRFELPVRADRAQFVEWWKDAARRFRIQFADFGVE